MTLKEARKAARGLISRIEKVTLFDCSIWDPKAKKIYQEQIAASDEKDLLRGPLKILEYAPVETRRTLYAMPAETFRASATKIIEIESED